MLEKEEGDLVGFLGSVGKDQWGSDYEALCKEEGIETLFEKIEGDNMKPKFDSLKFCVISIIDNLFLVLVFLALFGLFKILHIFFNI